MLVKGQYRYVLGIVLGVMALLANCTQPDSPASGKWSAGDARLTLSLSLDTGVSTPQTNSARTVAPQPGVVKRFEAVVMDGGTLVGSGSTTTITNNAADSLTVQVKILKNNLTLTVTAYDAITGGKIIASGTCTIDMTDLLSTNVLELKLTSTGSGKAKIELPVKFPVGGVCKNTSNITGFKAELWKTGDDDFSKTTSPALGDMGIGYKGAVITFDNVDVPASGSLFLVMRFYSGNNTPLAVFLESVIVYAGFVSNKWIDHRKENPVFEEALIFEDGDFPSLDTDIEISIDGIGALTFDASKNAYLDKSLLNGTFDITITLKTAGGSFQVKQGDSDVTGDFTRTASDDTSIRVYSANFSRSVFENRLSIISRAEDGLTTTTYTVKQPVFRLNIPGNSSVPASYHDTLQGAVTTAQTGVGTWSITALTDTTLTAAVTIDNSKKIILTTEADEQITLTRGDAAKASLISVTGGAEFTLRTGGGAATLTIDGAKDTVTTSGPLIQVSGSTFTLEQGVTLTNNKNTNSNSGGGGVYLMNGATMTMSGGTISGNKADTYGGGVYLTNTSSSNPGAAMIMSGGTISGNTATSFGGGVYLGKSTITMSGGAVSGNKATSGGGVYLVTGSSMTMKGGFVSGNTATSGGGVFVVSSNSKIDMEGGNVSGNTATSSGGGVYITNTATMTMKGGMEDGSYVSGNAASSGGGVYVTGSGSKITMQDGAVIGPQTDIAENTAQFGGGVFLTDSAAMEMTGGTVFGNTATGILGSSGGGVYIANGAAMTMSGNAIVSGNSADAYGGGVYLTGSSSTNKTTMTMSGGAVSGNTATDSGGGVYVTGSGSQITMKDGAVIGGSQPDSDKNTAQFGGGVFLTSSAVMAMEGGAVSGNTANNSGGGVFLTSSSSTNKTTMTMSDNAVVSGNLATYGGGVFLTAQNTIMYMGGGSVSGNSATYSGGGVSVTNSALFYIQNGTIYGKDEGNNSNTAPQSGGALYVSNSTAQYGSFVTMWGVTSWDGTALSSTDNTIKIKDGSKLSP